MSAPDMFGLVTSSDPDFRGALVRWHKRFMCGRMLVFLHVLWWVAFGIAVHLTLK